MSEVFTTLDAALAAIDVATTDQDEKTTALVDAITSLQDRVKADDLEPGELDSLLADIAASASAISSNATRISDASATVAGIEPSDVEVDPIEEIPPIV